MSIKNLEIKPSEAKSVEIASLPTRPTSSATYGGRGLTAQEMKKAYDAYPALIKERFNALIADLLSGIAINDIPFSIPAHEPFGENIEQTVKGFLDAVGDILDFGTDNARTIFGFVKQFVNDVAKATSLEYDKSTKLLSLTIDGQKKSVKFDDISTLQTNVGNLQTDMSVAKNDIADLKESKLDKTGGTISGNLEVTGNLNVLGKTIESVLEKLNVKDAVIVTNADGSTLTVLSGFATRTGTDTTYGIMYDPASDSVKLGIVTVDENGVYHFADGEGSPVATRADSANMSNGKIVTWNATKRRMETTTIPAVVDSAPTNGSSNLVTSGAVWQSEEDVISLVFNVGNGWGIQYEKDNDVLVLRNSFTSSESSVVLGIKDINDRVDFLSTLLFNTIITNTTVEDTYTSRVTAGGLPVVSNTPTTVHRIAGETKASENLIDLSIESGTYAGITISSNNNTWTLSGTPTSKFSTLKSGTLPSWLGGKTVTVSQSKYFASYNEAGAVYISIVKVSPWTTVATSITESETVTLEEGATYRLLIMNGNTSNFEEETVSFMVNLGETALPYSDYYAGMKNAAFKGVTSTGAEGETDTSFQLSASRQLRKWDYIDVDNQRVVYGSVEHTEETEFTDEELASFPEYILSADRKTIVYHSETPTTEALTVPKTYTVWRNGSETLDTGAADALPPTITQTYYEEVTSA